jgi:hypothetical protein
MERNHGTAWCGKEMRQLYTLMRNGYSLEKVAEIMQRTPGACKTRYCILRISDVFLHGKDDDTLKTFNKFQQTKEVRPEPTPNENENKFFYRCSANGLALGVCAESIHDAMEILKNRIYEYGEVEVIDPIVTHEGMCNWELGSSLIYGELKDHS